MRVTQNMISNNMLRHLMDNQVKMDQYLEQLYTGKKINRPSDDPVVAMKGMRYRTQVTEVEQYKRNTNELHNWMDNSDAALDKATLAMQRMRELAVQASNSTYGDDERQSIKEEVEQLSAYMVEIANTNVNGKYIFNGTNTNEKPVNIDADGNLTTADSSQPVIIQVAFESQLQANVNPEDVFTDQLFESIDEFIGQLDHVGESDEPIDIGSSLNHLDDAINDIINARADLGARMNRLELIEDRLGEQEIIAKQMMSENEDIHFEEAITNLITQESLYRASLAAGSRIIQPTLLDFLR